MEIIDSYPALLAAFEGSEFSFECWKGYIDAALPGLRPKLVADVRETLRTGGVSESLYRSVLNAACRPKELEVAHESFLRVTDGLDRRIEERFGKSLDVTVVFYLGLCNSAGWVTEYDSRTAILLGVEKILELNWGGIDALHGLIDHELGHVYQKQYGTLERTFDQSADTFLWQLFTEGVAMCFEQTLVGDAEYFHQDKNGWKAWCDGHIARIATDFAKDLETLSPANQRYFGDWVSYHGHGDVGYYLGCRFVRFLLSDYAFDRIICFDISKVKAEFERFCRQLDRR